MLRRFRIEQDHVNIVVVRGLLPFTRGKTQLSNSVFTALAVTPLFTHLSRGEGIALGEFGELARFR